MKVKKDELWRLIMGAKRIYLDYWFVTGEGKRSGVGHARLSTASALDLFRVASNKDVFTVHFHEVGVTKGHLYIENGEAA